VNRKETNAIPDCGSSDTDGVAGVQPKSTTLLADA